MVWSTENLEKTIGIAIAIFEHVPYYVLSIMPDDVGPFLIGVALLVLYLAWSAATEMGTRPPWRK
ncbi:MAG: hypothetical protein WBA99_02710 [Nodosilinea sp.]